MIWFVMGGVCIGALAYFFDGRRAARAATLKLAAANKTIADQNRRTSIEIARLRAANEVWVQRAHVDGHRADQLALENARLRQKLAELAVTT